MARLALCSMPDVSGAPCLSRDVRDNRMRVHVIIATLMIFGLFKGHATPEQDFWQWFQKNEDTLFHFEKDQERVFGRLAAQMKRLHPSLTFEFGPVANGKREFVISADGIKEAFPAVERLHAAAPKFDRWVFIKFRPRRTPMDLEYEGVKVKADAILCSVRQDKAKVGVTVYIPGYREAEDKTYAGIAFLFLDQALGEYDVETKVGFIEVKDVAEKTQVEKKPLQELTRLVDEFWKYRKDNGEPNGAANGSPPVRSETNRTSSAAGSRR